VILIDRGPSDLRSGSASSRRSSRAGADCEDMLPPEIRGVATPLVQMTAWPRTAHAGTTLAVTKNLELAEPASVGVGALTASTASANISARPRPSCRSTRSLIPQKRRGG